jgi:hypothetical protein
VAELLDEVITALPAEQRQTYNDWRNREVEGVTSHLTGVVLTCPHKRYHSLC